MANIYIDAEERPLPPQIGLDGHDDKVLLLFEFGDDNIFFYIDDSERALEIARGIETAVRLFREAGGT